ncbi:DUF4175 domain-containing protein [Candidatus Kirkpatrickella diaphorinae]|uniref:DUF4175 domain-containing protein n=1 Tax=Candidatus Kirkpatrickella diaphorinae TaxID=2984322 RepID=A0ABY6GMU4_9PROT|nr:DUF4175 family protein [Candidatus Kirkpatrickella diaphorinae]UYH52096.1 DUF4175 domain-containing protein [Candidatus Kirkpatrickella diaphorinae]
MRARRLQRGVILGERIVGKLVWPAIIFLFYGAISLFRVPQSLPDLLHSSVALAIVALLAGLLLHGLNRVRRPTGTYIDRRLEQGSALDERPLATMEDRPVDPTTRGIWKTHVARSLARIATLRPSIRFPQISRTGLCLFLIGILAFGVGLYRAGPHAVSRLEAGFVPGMDDADTPLPELHAWVTPPAYAPGPPVYYEGGTASITVPPGASLEVQVIGARTIPWLVGAVDSEITTARLGPQSWRLTEKLLRNGDVTLRTRGRAIARWRVNLLPDPPPAINWEGKPKIEADITSLKVRYKTSQPFGIASVSLSITPDNGLASRKPVIFTDTAPSGKHAYTGTIREDTGRLAYAGEPVTLRLKATSVSGNVAESEARQIILPAYKFHDPISRALNALRYRVLRGEEALPIAREELASLASLTQQREKGVTLLALNLMRDNGTDVSLFGDGLWSMAMYLDDLSRQGRAIAEANLALRGAQNGLIRALEGNASPPSQKAGIARQNRIDAVKKAIARRMQILMFHAMEQSGMVPDMGSVVPGRNDAVTRLLERLQDHASEGDQRAAIKNLLDLEDMTRRIRDATPEELAAAAKQEAAQQKARLHIRVVQDLIKRETGLLDATQSRGEAFRRLRDMQQEPGLRFDSSVDLRNFALGASDVSISPPSHDNLSFSDEEEAERQDQRRTQFVIQGALRDALRALIAEVSDDGQHVPKNMKKAEHHMGNVRRDLAQRDDIGASQSLRDVLADLTQLGHDMRAAQKDKQHGEGPIILLPTMQSGGDESGSQKDGDGRGDRSDEETNGGSATHRASQKRDPLGRKVNDGEGASESEQGHALQQSDTHRLEVERELRRRAADRARPPRERHYLEDLLKAWREGD